MNRLDLDAKLKRIANDLNIPNVYYKPPAHMKFPCILYTRSRPTSKRADNKPYINKEEYKISYITEERDSTVPYYIAEHLNNASFDTDYQEDNLHYYIINTTIIINY